MYAVYLRKSRADLEAEAMGQGETLARHRAALLDYAARHGLEIGAVYEEIISADALTGIAETVRAPASAAASRLFILFFIKCIVLS